jgi:hypothetical protein
MRIAGSVFSADENDSAIASDYGDRIRHREEARIIYDMILKGEIPNPGEDTMKRLMDQISGVKLPGV